MSFKLLSLVYRFTIGFKLQCVLASFECKLKETPSRLFQKQRMTLQNEVTNPNIERKKHILSNGVPSTYDVLVCHRKMKMFLSRLRILHVKLMRHCKSSHTRSTMQMLNSYKTVHSQNVAVSLPLCTRSNSCNTSAIQDIDTTSNGLICFLHCSDIPLTF